MSNKNDDNAPKDDESTASNITPFPSGGKKKKPPPKLSGLVSESNLPDNGMTQSEPMFNLPPVTKAFCLLFIAVQLVMQFLPEETAQQIIMHYGFVSARYTGEMPFSFYAVVSPITHMFLHGGWLHLGMNLGMFMAFATGLERLMGAKRVLILFFVTGIAGAFMHAVLATHTHIPVIGASGGISGLFGAMMMMIYDRGMLGKGYMKLILLTAVWVLISIFFGYFGMPGESNGIAWIAHVGGFIMGLFLYRPVLRLSL